MTTRSFAPWVEPVARELRETRADVVRTARQLMPDLWSRPSPLEGWTYKDLLAHLATGDWVFQTVLEDIVNSRPVDVATVANLDWVNQGNAQRLEERRDRSPEELIDEVIAESEKTQALLERLRAQDEGRKQADAPVGLSEYMRGFSGHDRGHLAQLKTALDQVML